MRLFLRSALSRTVSHTPQYLFELLTLRHIAHQYYLCLTVVSTSMQRVQQWSVTDKLFQQQAFFSWGGGRDMKSQFYFFEVIFLSLLSFVKSQGNILYRPSTRSPLRGLSHYSSSPPSTIRYVVV
jgi:hypothetical protein